MARASWSVLCLLLVSAAGCLATPDGPAVETRTDSVRPEATTQPATASIPPPQQWWALDWHDPGLWRQWNQTDPVDADSWTQGIPVGRIWSVHYHDGTVGVRFERGEAHAWSYASEVQHVRQAAQNITARAANATWSDTFVAGWETDGPRTMADGRLIREWRARDPGIDASWLLTDGNPETRREEGHNAWGDPAGIVFTTGLWSVWVESPSLERYSQDAEVEVDALGTVVGLARTADQADARAQIARIMEAWGGIPEDAVARPVSIHF